MKKIFVAGHNGMVGSSICRALQKKSNIDIITASRKELNLCDQGAVEEFMKLVKPDEVILAAAKVGGIYANNTYPADFIYQNLQIQNNVIHYAHINNVQKLLFLGSSCIYPKYADQPILESAILSGELEATNEPYAIAKIAGMKMCESYNRQYGRDYRSVMPTNLYGPGDNYHSHNSHVVPALIRRMHEAKESNIDEVIVWGSGTPKREFLHVDDMASASLFVHDLEPDVFKSKITGSAYHINVGTGVEITIKELAVMIKSVVGFRGKIVFDSSKPDGTPRKLLDIGALSSLGWNARVSLTSGLIDSYEDFIDSNLRET